jgi:hypothetical protein
VNPSIQVNSQGAYSVTVTDNNGCSASDEILVSVLTGINTVNSDVAVRVFPNPAKDNITVDISGIPSKTVVMRILSVDGKQISREEVNTFNSTAYKTLSLQGVAAGVYVLNVESDKFSKTFRIVIE